jgi:hypothetical protein
VSIRPIDALLICVLGVAHACAPREGLPSLSPAERDQRDVELAAMQAVATRFAGVPLLFDGSTGPRGERIAPRDTAWIQQLSRAANARAVFRDSVLKCGKESKATLGDSVISDQDCMLTPGFRLAFLGPPHFLGDTADIAVEILQADSSRYRMRASTHYVQWYFVRDKGHWRIRG